MAVELATVYCNLILGYLVVGSHSLLRLEAVKKKRLIVLSTRGTCDRAEKVLWRRYSRCAESFVPKRKGYRDLAGPFICSQKPRSTNFTVAWMHLQYSATTGGSLT